MQRSQPLSRPLASPERSEGGGAANFLHLDIELMNEPCFLVGFVNFVRIVLSPVGSCRLATQVNPGEYWA
jgi:hypothetical protein